MYIPGFYTGGKILPFLSIKSKRTKLGLTALLLLFSIWLAVYAVKFWQGKEIENLIGVLFFLTLVIICFLGIKKLNNPSRF